MLGSLNTKSNTARTISELRVVTLFDAPNVQSKAYAADGAVAMPDTLMYIINFADSAGYIMMAADNRVPEQILTFSDNGNIGDTIDNPGMALFMSYAEDYIINSISKAEAERDSITAVIKAKLDAILAEEAGTKVTPVNPGWSIEGDIEIIESWGQFRKSAGIDPLLPVNWNQSGFPYNNYVRFYNCPTGEAPAGCVAVAIAQIMAYWQYPSNYGGYYFNWARITADQIAGLMKMIGAEVGMNYSCTESGAQTSDGIALLKRMGYSYSGPIGNVGYPYSYTSVTSSLNQRRPVVSSGYAKKVEHKVLGIVVSTTYEQGHAWVIDGYCTGLRRYTETYKITDPKTGLSRYEVQSDYDVEEDFIHNNWGWGGTHNGYFASGCFDACHGSVSFTTKSIDTKNYQYERVIYPNIYR